MLKFFDDYIWTLHKHGDLGGCIKRCEEGLKELEPTPFHIIVGRDLLENKESAAEFITSFAETTANAIELKSIYIEMNGFDINPDLWFIDIFGYTTFQSLDDPDWLSDWQSGDEYYGSLPLYGYEMMQKLYERYCGNDEYKEAMDITNMLIPLRLQELIKTAHQIAKEKNGLLNTIPIISTAHDYDFFYISK